MKMWIVLIALCVCCLVGACKSGYIKKKPVSANQEPVTTEAVDPADAEDNEERSVQMEKNRKIIAEALNIEEDARNMRYILDTLNSIGAGSVQSAHFAEEDGERKLYLTAEDGTEFCMYLTGRGSVNAVENLTTGEWPFMLIQ